MLRRGPFLPLGANSTLDESLLAGLQATWTKGRSDCACALLIYILLHMIKRSLLSFTLATSVSNRS